MPRNKMLDAVDQLDVIGAILHVLQRTELGCRHWSENSQKELAFEIGATVNRIIEARDYERKLYNFEEAGTPELNG